MGQYHYTVNLTKREFIHPHQLGDGLKLLEQCGWSPGGTNDALKLLLSCSSGRGGGDYQSPNFADDPNAFVGRWAGDRIAVVGDYAEDADLTPEDEASTIYSRCHDPEDGDDVKFPPETWFRNITNDLIPVLEREFELIYCGTGWKRRLAFSDIAEYCGSHGRGDRMVMFKIGDKGIEIPSSVLRDAMKKLSHEHRTITLETIFPSGVPV